MSSKPLKRSKYNDRPRTLAALQALEQSGSVRWSGVLTVCEDPGVGQHEASAVTNWMRGVLSAVSRGQIPDISAFDTPALVLRDRDRTDDLRSRMLANAEAIVAKADHCPQEVTAFQVVLSTNPVVRCNARLGGAFIVSLWSAFDGVRAAFAWELLSSEQATASHITVIRGHAGGERSSIVFWNFGPSVIRTLSDERIAKLLEQSVGVHGARMRLRRLQREDLSPADIRSHLYEQLVLGRHPVAIGSSTVDALTRHARNGLTGLNGKLVPLHAVDSGSDLADPAEGPDAILERKDEHEKLREAIKDQTPRQQEILALHAKGLKRADIARSLGVSRAAVTQCIKRATALLRQRLAR